MQICRKDARRKLAKPSILRDDYTWCIVYNSVLQKSLHIMSVSALKDSSPYKKIYTHISKFVR